MEPSAAAWICSFAGTSGGIAESLAVRHDNGSQYVSNHFQSEIAFLGIGSSLAALRAG